MMIKKYLLHIARLSLMFSLSLGTQSSLLATAAPDTPASTVVTKEHTHIFLMLDQVYGLLASSTGPLEVLRQQLAASTNALVALLHASEIILLDAKRQKQVTETIAILSNYNGLYHKPEQASVEMNAQFKAFAELLLSKTAPILPTACTFCFKDFTHGQKLLSLKCVCQTCSLKGDINVFCKTCPIIGQCPNYLEL